MAMNWPVNGEFDMMLCEGLFDNIDDLLDLSPDDDEALVEPAAAAAGNGCQQIAPPAAAAAALPSTNGEGSRLTATSEENKFCDDINIGEDWITNFLDDSNFYIDFPVTPNEIIAAAAAVPTDGLLFQSFSPVSVLDESNILSNLSSSSSSEKGGSSSSSSFSSSSSSTNNETGDTVSLAPVGPSMMLVPARARSKRPRRPAPAPAHLTVPIIPPASEGPPAVPTFLPECESFGESPCPAPPMKKKKKKTLGSGAAGGGNAGSDDGMTVRKCQHCGLQKTPQWRAGPMGPKTLCNACGVRYKSGRLFPEYRPAASPTFVPSLHSNSHRKVVEMRIKACQQKAVDGMRLPECPAAKNCDLLAYIRRSE